MAYAVQKVPFWVNKEQREFISQPQYYFNPLELPLIRTFKPVGSLNGVKDIHGIRWDIRQISGPIIWCCTNDEIKPWMYSTATDRGIGLHSSTSNFCDTQIWHARINITAIQDHLQMKSAEDVYGDMFEIGGETYEY